MLEPIGAEGAVLHVQLETLKTFKSRIDGVISTLDGSAAAPQTVGKDRVAQGHLGKGFVEAEALSATYNQVHDQLETFSGLLADQIQAMQITVDGAQNGYHNVDVAQQEKVWAIYRRTRTYDQTHDPTGAPAPQTGVVCAAPSTTPQPQDGVGGISG
ncbi:hypothetical protein POF50_026675 [Streptomyces sp. SL13]|uniref:Uncharacterized protein n=1 Tax=Streptantibioticus silvisoli TaxID=2705255 RepID=A0AA90H9Z4_9ACTN|nr:hypothetical protein [Streptantibioticus silvisoli]MDI5972887.1 hypothetical protein [Streptantibioticus silvisoli]